jgi:peptidoglycan-associated lipoprotein
LFDKVAKYKIARRLASVLDHNANLRKTLGGRIMKKLFPFGLAALLLFYGCASKPASTPLAERAAQEAGAGQRKQQGLTSESQKGKEGGVTEEDLAKADEERKRRAAEEEAMKAGRLTDIYFEFDSYSIRPDDIPVLTDLAARLSANQAAKLMVEGHCDERGTVEYNLALGQKRADAAKDYLVKLGVSDKRIRIVSYGKEAPLSPGHAEEAWAKNRRAHFVVQ